MASEEKSESRVDGLRKERTGRATAMATPAGVGIHGFVQVGMSRIKAARPNLHHWDGYFCGEADRAIRLTSFVACPFCFGPTRSFQQTATSDISRIGYQVAVNTCLVSEVPIGAVVSICKSCDVRFVSLPEAV